MVPPIIDLTAKVRLKNIMLVDDEQDVQIITKLDVLYASPDYID